ncbi:ATP-binding protein [Candidatus Vallotia cooleyia]|uniref:ATP-binding protein n=1 Tax=Candidatus Vallotiella adelgis TaxID=1177211 RepID=UPI001D025232|nr:ATP-binding protein [Candidatus Vallotia cooleyia]UDG82214.1 hypothetical protein GJV44_00463 [Candidatus Vallotia cooleyia]
MYKSEQFLTRTEALIKRLEDILLSAVPTTDWDTTIACRWRSQRGRSFFQPIVHLPTIQFSDLRHIDRQKTLIEQNTHQFIRGLPANNVLLTGSRGTGKSSLIHACLNRFSLQGLRLIEVDKNDLQDLGDIVEQITSRPERFIIFCDDLSFEKSESSYKALKVVLDGSMATQSDNVLIYATSNLRNLLPGCIRDNETYRFASDGEIHPGEVVEEKMSLSERFGLWVSFHPFKQDDYLAIVAHWLMHFSCSDTDINIARSDALVWALERGSRSGRVAWQFARDWAGRHQKT